MSLLPTLVIPPYWIKATSYSFLWDIMFTPLKGPFLYGSTSLLSNRNQPSIGEGSARKPSFLELMDSYQIVVEEGGLLDWALLERYSQNEAKRA
ncbi:hypothetical protein PVK06_008254 [Gossypium arboreum]|uniref:Uncharacterized protein n=1 Tax=Gossypium arboreum TaxID=29729 RepID=A0ABR0QJG5_GOSAR|nr:hypothetical protein PVK06_008254 [Gossypium arboreum]